MKQLSRRDRISRRALSVATIETLEERRLFSADVWTGGAGDRLWSTPGNWANNAVPAAGDDIEVSANAEILLTSNVTVGNITFDGGGAQITPDNDGPQTMTLNGNIQGASGYNRLEMPVLLNTSTTVNLPTADSEFSFYTLGNSGNGDGITQNGLGTLNFDGIAGSYNGVTTINGGMFYATAPMTSPFIVNQGGTLQGYGVGDVTVDGGTFVGGRTQITSTMTMNGNFSFTGGTFQTMIQNSMFPFILPGMTSSPTSDKLVVNSGSIDLDGATLDVVDSGYTSTTGNSFTIISNQTGSAVVGTFVGLAEGATFTVGSNTYSITYHGGTSGHDVVLNAITTPAASSTGSSDTGSSTGDSGSTSTGSSSDDGGSSNTGSSSSNSGTTTTGSTDTGSSSDDSGPTDTGSSSDDGGSSNTGSSSSNSGTTTTGSTDTGSSSDGSGPTDTGSSSDDGGSSNTGSSSSNSGTTTTGSTDTGSSSDDSGPTDTGSSSDGGSTVTNPSTTVSTTITPSAPVVLQPMQHAATSSARPTLSIPSSSLSSLGTTGLTYNWSVASMPHGGTNVFFANNDTDAAQSTTARVHKAGTYVLNCVVTNANGDSISQQVLMTIKQIRTGIVMTPHRQVIDGGSTVQYTAIEVDQFKHAMRDQSPVIYTLVQGGGSIDAAGLYTAGQKQGHVVIQATIDDLTGLVGATVV